MAIEENFWDDYETTGNWNAQSSLTLKDLEEAYKVICGIPLSPTYIVVSNYNHELAKILCNPEEKEDKEEYHWL